MGNGAGFLKNFGQNLIIAGGYGRAYYEGVAGRDGTGRSRMFEEERWGLFEIRLQPEGAGGGRDGRPGKISEERVGFKQETTVG